MDEEIANVEIISEQIHEPIVYTDDQLLAGFLTVISDFNINRKIPRLKMD